MMKPHCDRCEKECDGYPKWVQDGQHVWHLGICSGRADTDRIFCRDCWMAILTLQLAFVRETRKSPVVDDTNA